MKKLLQIQQELKAPKDLFNNFGNYAYRSAESILQALKPLLKKNEVTLILKDELENIGERYYVKATASLYDAENGKLILETTAFAREEADKKGMDGSQITGASSSYARKYALNGMFAIDDVKDSDTTNTHPTKSSSKIVTPEEVKEIVQGKEIKNKCPKCGKDTSEKALTNWGMCATCYAKSKKESANG